MNIKETGLGQKLTRRIHYLGTRREQFLYDGTIVTVATAADVGLTWLTQREGLPTYGAAGVGAGVAYAILTRTPYVVGSMTELYNRRRKKADRMKNRASNP